MPGAATSLTMGTVSGDVQIKDSSSERALVRTVSGDIDIDARDAAGAAETVSGERAPHVGAAADVSDF